jgi:hypothetical protein
MANALTGVALYSALSEQVYRRAYTKDQADQPLAVDGYGSPDNQTANRIAGQATSELANFRQLAGARTVKIAPLVTRLIDPEVLAKPRAAADPAAFPEPQGRA